MADNIILSAARMNEASLWIQDVDFQGADEVQYIPKSE
jgi:hypothetical protein